MRGRREGETQHTARTHTYTQRGQIRSPAARRMKGSVWALARTRVCVHSEHGAELFGSDDAHVGDGDIPHSSRHAHAAGARHRYTRPHAHNAHLRRGRAAARGDQRACECACIAWEAQHTPCRRRIGKCACDAPRRGAGCAQRRRTAPTPHLAASPQRACSARRGQPRPPRQRRRARLPRRLRAGAELRPAPGMHPAAGWAPQARQCVNGTDTTPGRVRVSV